MHSRRCTAISANQFPKAYNGTSVPAPNFFIKYSRVRIKPNCNRFKRLWKICRVILRKGEIKATTRSFYDRTHRFSCSSPLADFGIRLGSPSFIANPSATKRFSRTSFSPRAYTKTINLYPLSVYMVRNLLLGDWEVYTANQQMTIEWLQRWTARYMCLQILHFYLIHGFQNFSIESVSHWQIQKFVEGEAIGARYKWNFLRSNMKR